ncbi:peptidoglycan-binding protein LysM [Methylopila jiangsuensis]|uniref:Potassium binding protein Kbp n=1 Tax=Methylopila jiangsuensis TaxID=586230 RepID=A0A9W6JJJ1_9HYPH|nr:peptidoglycan-binding protein LysM [Methylopila jiangsuensis]MDR6284428.1 nucleoid-associated protein YgaU [Methylopila jiangsuensis]GLK78187.1 peptidoglycan-binding protein LysM [Methylopila jiangsuensis]
MGIFDFIKDVGEKLFGASEAQAAPADKIKEELAKHGLDSGDVSVQVDGDTVKISGSAPSNEVREKIIIAAGNTLGVSKVEEDLKVATSEPEAKFYTVKKGDTLSKIAQEQYGKASRYPDIFEANKPMLTHPDKIYPGQVLRIPA